ncbi:hypothetical protein RAJCM14343_0954 [Rhodococcus aetherivorans]|uniref:Uncharacterized protein n=1 Tax=Rhodococcus aetherivorans TaxID=191292 RepID=A0ABQ0YGS9_9NOCA|nr:hypothetical protein RAJCM14343_0954 [Rhodococcus aetherivorans]CCW12180.1 hypothetical protein EBESD8_27290 [Rhodococcus aetherivorans]
MTLFPQPRRAGGDVSLGGTTGTAPAARVLSGLGAESRCSARAGRTRHGGGRANRSRPVGPKSGGASAAEYCGRAPRPHPQFRRGAPMPPAPAAPLTRKARRRRGIPDLSAPPHPGQCSTGQPPCVL